MTSKLDYLKKYLEGGGGGGGGDADGDNKKRKRKKETDGGGSGGSCQPDSVGVKKVVSGFKIVDEDNEDWKYKREMDEEKAKRDEETPMMVGEVGISAAAAAAKEKWRQYLGIREDGSGWAVAKEMAMKGVRPRGGGGAAAMEEDEEEEGGDLSPPRPGRRHDSDDDLSPPRAGRRHHSDDEQSTPRRGGRHDSDDDMSPPRRGGRGASKDLSPPRM
eukprot:CAMPEP_0197585230 /NCGR_PEP_ID=MMETSP1326-20131121/7592_1 /TAXON_ID=1155430 /ORGANISM="Genus nov. species nov., Strain RCC2288" /LENGTH=216 /DNA_ID=CAMNT_0043149701 /DNA_START=611 /DNA_END=1258 /DNA_ORIENTATION=-